MAEDRTRSLVHATQSFVNAWGHQGTGRMKTGRPSRGAMAGPKSMTAVRARAAMVRPVRESVPHGVRSAVCRVAGPAVGAVRSPPPPEDPS